MPISYAAEVRAIIPDFPYRMGAASLEQPMNPDQFRGEDVSWKGFGASFLRPIPYFLPINESELTWLAPGTITDLVWDNSSRITKQLGRACDTPLTKGETN